MANDNLKTPTVALGTWAWGDSGEIGNGYFGSQLTQDGLQEVVKKAQAAGFTLWDTARVYGMGHAEAVLGKVLKSYPRGAYQLSAKFTPQIAGSGENPMADMLELSLAALAAEYIDLYWVHNPADVTRWTQYLIPLLERGLIKHVGVSNHNLSQIQLADQILSQAGFRVEAVQNHYSLLYRNAEQAGILEHCRSQGIPFFGYMVLEQGALSGKYTPEHPMPQGSKRAEYYNGILPQLKTLTDKLASIGNSHGAAGPEIAVAWAIAKGATPIVGVTQPTHVDSLIRATGIKLTDDELATLEGIADNANVNTRGWWEQEM